MNEDRRIAEVERRVMKLEERTENLGVTAREVQNLWKAVDRLREEMHKEVSELADELSSVRRALYTAALSVTGGVLITALTILQVFR